MHNKRIGRDDLLKIEARGIISGLCSQMLTFYSGRALHHRLAGDSIPDVMSVAPSVAAIVAAIVAACVVVTVEAGVIALAGVAGLAALLGAAVTMVTASVTTTVVVTGTAASAETVLAAQRTVTVTVRWRTAMRSASVSLASVSMSARMALRTARNLRVSIQGLRPEVQHANLTSCRGQG